MGMLTQLFQRQWLKVTGRLAMATVGVTGIGDMATGKVGNNFKTQSAKVKGRCAMAMLYLCVDI